MDLKSLVCKMRRWWHSLKVLFKSVIELERWGMGGDILEFNFVLSPFLYWDVGNMYNNSSKIMLVIYWWWDIMLNSVNIESILWSRHCHYLHFIVRELEHRGPRWLTQGHMGPGSITSAPAFPVTTGFICKMGVMTYLPQRVIVRMKWHYELKCWA